MPTYEDTNAKIKSYYCSFYYTDYAGKRHRKVKRGFKLAREAKQYELDFLARYQGTPTILFKTLVELYQEDINERLKPSSVQTINQHIEYYKFFNDMPINEITPNNIREWQKQTKADNKNLTANYLHSLNVTLGAIFSFAVKYHKLTSNPCYVVGLMGTNKASKDKKLSFWTVEEFNKFIDTLQTRTNEKLNTRYTTEELTVIYKTLFYTGLRIGELLALTVADYDSTTATITVNKNLYKLADGQRIIQPPKTEKSNRTITLPQKLCTILDDHITHLQDNQPTAPLFTPTKEVIWFTLKRYAAQAELKEITIHDLRHSHASLLINAGVQPLAISERLGHENVQTTLNIYSHLYKATSEAVANTLNSLI